MVKHSSGKQDSKNTEMTNFRNNSLMSGSVVKLLCRTCLGTNSYVRRVHVGILGTYVLQRSWIYAPMSGIKDKSVT
jgi:hypothetical protein